MVVEGKMWGLMVIIGVLLVMMVPQTMQLSADHPLHPVVERINGRSGPFVAIVLSSVGHEKALLDSGYFVFDRVFPPPLNYAGRTFKFGRFAGLPCTYVVAPSPLAYRSSTVQILLDLFRIFGIIDFGNAGGVGDSLDIGDVGVVKAVAMTGYWNWKNELPSEQSDDLPLLSIGDFNKPTPGGNKLAAIEFQTIQKYSSSDPDDRSFWFHANDTWLQIASLLKDLRLEKCVTESSCLDREPKLVLGVKGSSSDILVANKAYGKFLNDNFDVSTVDRKSFAVISTANANGVPAIVVRAVTNKPGVPYDKTMGVLGTKNCIKFAAAFAQILGVENNNIRNITHLYN